MSFDAENSGLLDGLDGCARDQRAELIGWLIEQGFTAGEIRSAPAPLLLPVRRVLGDDGSYLSARQISARTGLELDQLTRFQRAAGLLLGVVRVLADGLADAAEIMRAAAVGAVDRPGATELDIARGRRPWWERQLRCWGPWSATCF